MSPLPAGYSKTKVKAQSKDRALKDMNHYCMGKPETKKGEYFWEGDDSDNEAIDAFFALVDAVHNYQKEIRLMFIRGKKSLYKWATRTVWQDEIYDHKLSDALLRAKLLRYRVTKGPGSFRDMRVVDIESIENVLEKPEEVVIVYRFDDELTQKATERQQDKGNW